MSFNSPFFDFFDAINNEVDSFSKILDQSGFRTYPSQRQIASGKDDKSLTKSKNGASNSVYDPQSSSFLSTDLDDWFDGNKALFPYSRKGDLVPPVDILDHEDNYELHVSVPGVKEKKDINLEYHKEANQIFVTGEIPAVSTTDETKKNVKVNERPSGKFKRCITLPQKPGIDADNIKANYNNGVLTLTVPKLAPSKDDDSVRKIEISSEESWGDSKI